MAVTKIQVRRDSSSNWESVNPSLHEGEIGYDTTSGRIKIGDGATAWIDLPYYDQEYTVASFNGRIGIVTLSDTDVNNALGYTAANEATLSSFITSATADIENAITTAENYTDSAISTEVSNRNSAIATAKSQAISTSESYTDSAISTEVTNRNSAISSALATAEGYTDTAKASAISTSESYTDTAIANLVSTAPSTLNTLAKIDAAINNDANFSSTLLSDIATAQATAEGYTDTAISTEVTNRNSAISSAISTEVTNRNSAIATAKSQAISTSESYTDSVASTLQGEIDNKSNKITIQQVQLDGTASYSFGSITTIQFDEDSGFAVTNPATGTVKIAMNSTFKYWQVNGTTQLTAVGLDTVNFITGSGISITGNGSSHPQSLTISVDSTIATKTYANSAASTAQSNAEGYTDSAISTEVTNRNSAISSAISTEVTNRNTAIAASLITAEGYTDTAKAAAISTSEGYTDSAISTEITNRNAAIATSLTTAETYTDTAKAAAISTSEAYTDTAKASAISTSEAYTDTAKAAAISTSEAYTDSSIATEVTNRNSAIATAKSQAITTSEGYTDSAISTEVTNRNSAIATSLTTAESYTDTAKASAISTSEGYTDTHAAKTTGTHGVTGTIVGTSDTQTLTNKTIDTASNTLKIAGTTVSSTTGSGAVVLATAPSVTGLTSDTVTTTGNTNVGGDLTISGNLHVSGTTVTTNSSTLAISDNLIYLNQPLIATITGATHNTTTVEYQVSADPGIVAGQAVVVSGITPTAYNIASSDNITVVSTRTQGNNHYFTVTKTVSVAYTSGGTAQFNSAANPDLGVVGAYTNGTGHAHAGVFRDVTNSNTWTFFQGYTPEPGVTINTGDASFALAPVAASQFTGSLVGNVTGNVTGNVSGNAGTVTNGVYTTDTGTVTSTMILDGTIVDADINAAAAIAKTKIAGTAVTQADTGTVTNTMLAGSIANNKLTNSSITVNGSSISLGGSATIKASTTNALTIGTGLSGTSFDGSGAVTIAINSSVVTLNDIQSLSNKTLKGPVYLQSGGGAGGSNNYITVDNSTGAVSLVSGYPLNLTATGNITLTPTGGVAQVGSDTIATLTASQTLTNKSISGSTNTLTNIPNSALTNSSITINGSSVSLGGSVSITGLPSQTGNAGNYLTTNGTTASWGSLPITTGTATVSTNTATTVDTTPLSSFTSIEYMVSLKQGTIIRTSKVLVQTDGTNVDSTEFGIVETGGTMAGISVTASAVSTNAVLQVTVTNAATTNVTVKFSKVAL